MRIHQKFEFNLMKGGFSDTKYILYTYVLICKHIYGRIEREKYKQIYTCCAGYIFVKLIQVPVLN